MKQSKWNKVELMYKLVDHTNCIYQNIVYCVPCKSTFSLIYDVDPCQLNIFHLKSLTYDFA